MTLIEVSIYSALLALLMTGFIRYGFDIYITNFDTLHQVEDAYGK